VSGAAVPRADLAVVGCGVIGLAIAWRCAQRGLRVTAYDPTPGGGASRVAAGMLAPVGEAYFGEAALTGLLVESYRRWAGFAAEVGRYGPTGYRTDGTLLLAATADDLTEAQRLWAYHASVGLPVTPLPAAALREREPALRPRLRGGALTTDHQVDPRRLLTALAAAARAAGVRIVTRRVDDLAALPAGRVVVAAGCGSARLTGLPVRPVKGQLLRLRGPGGAAVLRHVVRGIADGRRVYLVPRPDGEVVVGATEEERTDAVPTAGAVLDLLRAATDLVPELAEYELAEVCVGHRPGTPDNAPILGELRPGVFVAAGHYRHGVLAAPVTADALADLVTGAGDGALAAPFGPDRFGALAAARGGTA
jgi:glycine oxidase